MRPAGLHFACVECGMSVESVKNIFCLLPYLLEGTRTPRSQIGASASALSFTSTDFTGSWPCPALHEGWGPNSGLLTHIRTQLPNPMHLYSFVTHLV